MWKYRNDFMVLKVIWVLIMLKFQIFLNAEYKPYSGRTYIKLPKELDHIVKGLLIIQNIDSNEYLNDCWSFELWRLLSSKNEKVW